MKHTPRKATLHVNQNEGLIFEKSSAGKAAWNWASGATSRRLTTTASSARELSSCRRWATSRSSSAVSAPVRRARRVYEMTDAGRLRFSELVADTGPHNYTDDGFGVHLAFFNRTPAAARMRILEGRRRQVEERREGLREAIARASNSLDRYTRQLHQLGLESSEREVNWLNELIAAERIAQRSAEQA